MAILTTGPTYDEIYQLEEADDVIGGAGNLSNWQAQSLGNRDDYLLSLLKHMPWNGGNIDTTTFTTAYPGTVTLSPSDLAPGVIFVCNSNKGTYVLPPIATVDDYTTVAIQCLYGSSCYLQGDGVEVINDYDGWGSDNIQTVFALETLILKKNPAATSWDIQLRIGRNLKAGDIFLTTHLVLTANDWVKCAGGSASTTDPTMRRLFAQIGYTFGGSGGTFHVPTLSDPASGIIYAIKL